MDSFNRRCASEISPSSGPDCNCFHVLNVSRRSFHSFFPNEIIEAVSLVDDEDNRLLTVSDQASKAVAADGRKKHSTIIVTMTTPYYSAESSIPVIQGQPVPAPGSLSYQATDFPPPQGNYTAHAGDVTAAFHGEQQPNQCKDVLWAILFYAHLGVILFVTIRYAPMMSQDVAVNYSGGAYRKLSSTLRLLEEEDDGAESNNYDGTVEGETVAFDLDMTAVLTIVALAGLAALLVSSAAVGLMMAFPKPLIKMALFFNLFLTGAVAIMSLLAGAILPAIMIGLLFLVNLCYIRAVWSRIPFAAANLITAITAVKSNMGLTFFAYNNLFVTFFWSVWWSIAFVATTYVVANCNAEGYCENQMNGGLIFLFLVSFFWTAQVVKNVVHVTVAGTVGTWWLFPLEANGCCSQAVRDSYWRSITTSFGSICLGSLIVALIQATRELVNSMRDQNDGLLLCIADCLLGCLESLAEYFNKVCTTKRLVEPSNHSLQKHDSPKFHLSSPPPVGLRLCWTLWLWFCGSFHQCSKSL
jgi:hypothetical protein